MPKLFEAEIPRSWEFVRSVRTKIEHLLVGLPKQTRYAAGMVAAELVGNAIKYGDQAGPEPARISCAITDNQIVIEVSNSLHSKDSMQVVEQRVAEMTGPAKIESLFISRLNGFLTGHSRGSQLGLYRIGHEGKFNLSCSYCNSIITLRATRGLA